MIPRLIRNSIISHDSCNGERHRTAKISSLVEGKRFHNIETIRYNLLSVCGADLDPTGSFLIVGLCNGTVDLQGVEEPSYGLLDPVYNFDFGDFVNGLHRIQWNPGSEQFFSLLDNNNLYLIDPNHYRTLDTFPFSNKPVWSEWNPNDKKMIAVCGSESQTRLIDIRSGSSAQTIILGAKSGLASHRSTRCLWSKHDLNCLIIGDNEGCVHIYDTRHSMKPLIWAADEELGGQISGMSFKSDNYSILTTQGTENRIVEWNYDKCNLIPNSRKFKKRKQLPPPLPQQQLENDEASTSKGAQKLRNEIMGNSSRRGGSSNLRNHQNSDKPLDLSKAKKRQIISLSVDALIRCQFYVTAKHVFCPVPMGTKKKSKEVYVYNIETGDRVRTLKSDDILNGGVHSITGLFPDAVVIYVGGRGRLRVWTIDDTCDASIEQRQKKYHVTRWDSDDDDDFNGNSPYLVP